MRKADINKPNSTMYVNSRRTVEQAKNVLKLSKNKKISDERLPQVKKGRFKGYVIYTLTLEERATCPRECFHWDDCYGNNTPFAHRIQHGPELENKLRVEIDKLCDTYKGVIVRLHVLGDFYSVDYVKLWDELLMTYDNLAVWGYTAHKPTSAIGKEIANLRKLYSVYEVVDSPRFNVRFSDAGDTSFSALSSDKQRDTITIKDYEKRATVCPEQTGRVANCASCCLCWQSSEPIIFLTH